MRGLQVGVELMQAVTVPIVVERITFIGLAGHHAHHRIRQSARAHCAVFVDVIAVVIHKIESLGGDALVRGEKTRFVTLAAGNGKTQLRQRRAHARQGARAADDTAFCAHGELIKIVTCRFEARYFHMHRVPQFGMRNGLALLHSLLHALVARHHPCDLDLFFRHAAAALQRLGRKLGPQHETVGRRITGRHAKRKRVRRKHRLAPHRAREQPAARGDQRRNTQAAQQMTAIHRGKVVYVQALGKAGGHRMLLMFYAALASIPE